MNQKEATYQAVVGVLTNAGIKFHEGMDVSGIMSNRELRSQVNAILFEGFRNGAIQLEREFSDAELKAYVSGLQSNWIRKDSRLNGNTKYVAKNPGSRQGSGDAQLKAMRALLETLIDPSDKAEVQQHIDARLAELAKAKAPVIDLSHLPEALRAKFTK